MTQLQERLAKDHAEKEFYFLPLILMSMLKGALRTAVGAATASLAASNRNRSAS